MKSDEWDRPLLGTLGPLTGFTCKKCKSHHVAINRMVFEGGSVCFFTECDECRMTSPLFINTEAALNGAKFLGIIK